MSRILRRLAVSAALSGWLVASGLAWDGLQLAAWAGMAWKNAATMDGAAAVRQAVTGAPCSHCLSIREARRQTDAQSPTAEPTKRVAIEFPLPGAPFPALLVPRERFTLPEDRFATRRDAEVEVPPPRSRVV